MSILIKGMEMPENCHECEFVDILPTCPCNKMADEDFWNNVSLAVEGHKDCPLVLVPPHGRLIDADALMLIIQEYIDEYGWDVDEHGFHSEKWCAMKETEMAINDAPTVIPADEDGET